MFKNLSAEGIGISGRQSEVIEAALSFGFKGIDLDLVDFQAQVKTHGLPHAKRLIESARLKIGSFRLPLAWDNSDAAYQEGVKQLPELLGFATALGAKRAIATVGAGNDARPYHENFEFHRRRLTELAGLLAPAGMQLGLEFTSSAEARKGRAFQFIHTFDALVTLVNMVRSPQIGVVLDPWEILASGGSLEDVRKVGGDRITAIYLSDAPADTDAGALTASDRLLPGESGRIDSASILSLAAELGFDGPITPRVDRSRVAGMRRDQIVKLAGERVEAAWKAAGLNPAGKKLATAKA